MLRKNKKDTVNQDGFITMIVIMIIILGAVIYFAYSNVASR